MDMNDTLDMRNSGQEADTDLRLTEPDRFEQSTVDDHRTVDHVSRTPNILDILNDDCWRHILDYVPLEDISSSEPVSRDWQAMVHRYRQGVRLRIETITNVWDIDEQIRRRKCRVVILKDNTVSLVAALNRWGACVRELVYDVKGFSEDILVDLGKKCPNLEDITFVRLRWYKSCDWVANFTRLKRVCFENSSMTDSCVHEFFKHSTIEELVIQMCYSVSGEFFVAIKEDENADLTKLKTLVLSNCTFKFSKLLSAVVPINRLTGVTKLELRCSWLDLPSSMSMLLDKLPQLQYLTLDCDWLVDEEAVEAATGLARLTHLGWHNGAVFRGKELQAVRKDKTLLAARPCCAEPLDPPSIRRLDIAQLKAHYARCQLLLEREEYLRTQRAHNRASESRTSNCVGLARPRYQ